ncbi:lysoplasmalogenase family protein [Yunchengibacter salinarum]|uniref:lysoplasmalogenase family protein n=1 Tax=Yunchengibacter salinarum TaxID=3133399 RepID=UPI0035B5CB5D
MPSYPLPAWRRWPAALLVALSLGAALAHGLGIALTGGPSHLLVKGGAMGALALATLLAARRPAHLVVALALAFAAVGDMLITLPGRRAFLHALGAFGATHVLLTLLFIQNRAPLTRMSVRAQGLAGAVVAGAMLASVVLWPVLDGLRLPVLAYLAVLAIMAITALWSRFPQPLAGFGALAFLLSDAALAADRFLALPAPVQGVIPLFIWPLYVGGLYAIALAVWLDDGGRRAFDSAPGGQ